jgi:cell division protein FtsA
MDPQEHIIAGLDIGSTKVEAIIAEVVPPGPPKIIGVGRCRSDGLRRGMVVDLDKTTQTIRTAMSEAEMMAGCSVATVTTAIAGEHIRSINSRGVVAVSRQSDEIGPTDIERVVDAARALPIPQDREIIHVLPMEYLIDDQSGIKRPEGMFGSRLEAEVLIVTGAMTAVRNIYKSVQNSGYEVADLTLESLACGRALLDTPQQETGVAIINLGGGITDIAIFYDESIRYNMTLAVGGRNITSDIAIGLRTPIDDAENIKIVHGSVLVNPDEQNGPICVPGVGDRPPREVSSALLASIIEPRAEEIFELTLREIKKTPYFELLTSGIILTGGGALLPGMVELAERIFDLPVRVGRPSGVEGMKDLAASPAHTTAVGLLLHGANHIETVYDRDPGVLKRWARKMGYILNEFI